MIWEKHSYRLSYLNKSATMNLEYRHMKAAITEIILEPSLSAFIMIQKGGGRGRGGGRGVCANRGGV